MSYKLSCELTVSSKRIGVTINVTCFCEQGNEQPGSIKDVGNCLPAAEMSYLQESSAPQVS